MIKSEIINAIYPIVRDTQTCVEIADAILAMPESPVEAIEAFKHKNYGLSLVAQERYEQVYKHGRTIEQDGLYNAFGQLTLGASGKAIWLQHNHKRRY